MPISSIFPSITNYKASWFCTATYYGQGPILTPPWNRSNLFFQGPRSQKETFQKILVGILTRASHEGSP
jgi:hypothetical protein